MDGINFIPVPRREVKACRTRLRRWGIGLSIYVAALSVGYGVCASCVRPDTSDLDEQCKVLAAQMKSSKVKVLSLRRELAEAQGRLGAARAVGRHADWGVLLALVARNVGDEVVLARCRLESRERPGAAAAGGGPAERLVLELNGFARSQTQVSDFILRLEKTGLFDAVRLVKTGSEEFLSVKAVGFQVACALEPDRDKVQ